MQLTQTTKAHNALVALVEFYADVAVENAALRERVAQLEAALKRAIAQCEAKQVGGG